MEVLPLRASDVRSLDNCINVVVVRVFKLSSYVNVQVVRSRPMLDLNDILSLVAKRRSRFLCNYCKKLNSLKHLVRTNVAESHN